MVCKPHAGFHDEYLGEEPPELQHENFLNVIRKHGAEIVYPESIGEGETMQTFVRDPAMVIRDRLFFTGMRIRKGEKVGLSKLAKEIDERKIIHLPGLVAEGGNVIINGEDVYIGQQGSTDCPQSVERLREALGAEHNVIPIDFESNAFYEERIVHHLDTVFNILSKDVALAFTKGIEAASLKRLKERFKIISISREEQFCLGANVFNLGNKVVVSQKRKCLDKLNSKLAKQGFTVEEVNYSTFVDKAGGFRCTTMPLVRDKE